tara:strand:+ start:488 stop:985 length:498 start_codon:yes stop_codon:yes gene_type:complete
MEFVEVEEENKCENNLIDFFESENKLDSEDFLKVLPTTKPNTFDIQKINYLLGNVNICNRDNTNDLRTHYIINNKDLTIKNKLNLLVDNYKNYYNLPEDFLVSIAREKLNLPFDYHDVKKRRKEWLEKCKKEKEEDLQENRFEKQLNKQKQKEGTFKIEKKIITF